MPQIFISYRRDDSQTIAGRIYDRLVTKAFPSTDVFKDSYSIRPGDDFRGKIHEEIAQCDIVLVIIGPQWANITDSQGRRRLDNPGDWVRIEVETALQRANVRVIPLLVDDASVPSADELPPSLHELAYKQGIPIRDDPDFYTDMDRLVEQINAVMEQQADVRPAEAAPDQPAAAPSIEPGRRGFALPIILILAFVVIVILVQNSGLLTPPVVTPTAQAATSTATEEPPTMTPELTPTMSVLDQPATLALLNQWRADSGMNALAENPALQAVAEEHVSYLRSLPLPELESTNVFRNADGQDVVFMASDAGYSGDVVMVVEISDADVTLQDVLDRVDDPARYTDVGFRQVRAIATGKLYFVLILGAGG